MKKDIILEIFGYLRGRNIVSSESEFSMDWLGHSESYLRKLRQMKAEPSLGSVAICASRLQNAAEQLAVLPRYRHIGEQLAHMSQKCRALVDADSVEFDLAG